MIIRLPARPAIADPRSILRAVRQEVARTPRGLRAWYGILGVLCLVGAAGAVRSLIPGDKGIGTTPTFEWGLLIVGYVFFAITTSGLCLASSLGTVFGIDRFRPLEKRHALLAVLCLVTAFGVIALDLHYPVRMVFGAVLNPSPSSPMWWMGVFYGTYLCFLLTEVWSIFWRHERIHGIACLLSSVMAIVAPSTLGAVFGVLAARPYWAGVFTPLLMVATALLSGTALLAIVFYAVVRLRLTGYERAGVLAIPAIRSVLTIALVAVTVLVARQLIVGLGSADVGLSAATRALLSGPLAVQFVGVRLVVGLALPLAILAVPWTRGAGGVLVAGCLAIVGVFADRLTFVSAGQIAPTTATSGVVSAPYATYTPSPVEISILVGAVALVALLYTLAERYLDLSESEVHFGLFQWLDPGRFRGRIRPFAPAATVDAGEPDMEPRARGFEPASITLQDPPQEPETAGPGSEAAVPEPELEAAQFESAEPEPAEPEPGEPAEPWAAQPESAKAEARAIGADDDPGPPIVDASGAEPPPAEGEVPPGALPSIGPSGRGDPP
jgi:Ni/Fe-hydrogenase subunit HybB-like protein